MEEEPYTCEGAPERVMASPLVATMVNCVPPGGRSAFPDVRDAFWPMS